jgi:hypothetical protein
MYEYTSVRVYNVFDLRYGSRAYAEMARVLSAVRRSMFETIDAEGDIHLSAAAWYDTAHEFSIGSAEIEQVIFSNSRYIPAAKERKYFFLYIRFIPIRHSADYYLQEKQQKLIIAYSPVIIYMASGINLTYEK